MLIPALNVGAVQSLTGAELAYASSAVNFVRQLGGAAGVNLLAVFLEWRLYGAMTRRKRRAAFHECFILVDDRVRRSPSCRLGPHTRTGELAMYQQASWLPTTAPPEPRSPSTNART